MAATRPADAPGLPGQGADPLPAGPDRSLHRRLGVRQHRSRGTGSGSRSRSPWACCATSRPPSGSPSGRVELRRGLLNRHLLSTPLDRVRTVDVTASLIHRALGLTSVRIGTGTASTETTTGSTWTACRSTRARQLRTELLLLGESTGAAETPLASAEPLLRFDPAWVRFAPLTSSGLVIAAGVLGAATQAGQPRSAASNGSTRNRSRTMRPAGRCGSPSRSRLVALVVAVAALSIGGYLVTNWAFELTHTGTASRGAWHLRRGLLTTRETTLDDERVRGVSLGRAASACAWPNGARVSAIVTGLGSKDSGSSILVPPAPLRGRRAGRRPRAPHPRAPRRPPRRPRPAGARPAASRERSGPLPPWCSASPHSSCATGLPAWALGVAVLGVPTALLLARDRADALGHALVEGHLVARSGQHRPAPRGPGARRRDRLEPAGHAGSSAGPGSRRSSPPPPAVASR